jgi:hypothetical protein
MNCFIRLLSFFFLISIVWGLIFGIWLSIYFGNLNGVLYGLKGGLIFGLIITITSALYDYLLRLRVFKKYGKKNFDVIQKREIILDGDIEDIIQKIMSALKMIKGVKKICPDYNTNKIFAIRGTTWRTFGEKIEININQEKNEIKVSIQSRPRLKTAIFDGGRNIENVEVFCSLLRRS